MFYVYEWFIVETNEVIYVGKGTRNRYKSKKKNRLLNKILELKQCDVHIIAYYETEDEAFEAERERILSLKNIGQAICNNATYSTGGTSSYWTEERRKEKSVNNPMKSKDQRERMSKYNPMKNPEVAKRVGMTRRKPIFIGEKEFSCAKEAADYFSVSATTIFNWVKSGHSTRGESCGYVKKDTVTHDITLSKQEFLHTIIYNGKEFKNAKEAAQYIGVKSNSTIIRWCKDGFSSSGVPCRYKDDTRELIYTGSKKAHGKPTTINGITYKSRKDAAFALGCSEYILYKLIRNECKHDNQQPSQGKSDNSTLEGSTTNE